MAAGDPPSMARPDSRGRAVQRQAMSFAFSASYSAWVMAPLSSSPLAFSMLARRAAAGLRDGLHVVVELRLRRLRVARRGAGAIPWPLAIRYIEHAEERQDDQERRPTAALAQPDDVMTAEHVADDH